MAADFYNTGQPLGSGEAIAVQENRYGRARFLSLPLPTKSENLLRRLTADCFKKITVFGILLFIAYSPLRCQKEQDSPLPRIRKC